MNSFDALTLEILWSRLISLVDEMAATMLRTSFSTVIGAANDFGCELLDSRGRGLAHATRSMPVFNQTLPHVTEYFIDKYGEESIRPGDIFITNDPWLCAGHQPDIAVILPFFRNGRRIGFAGSIGHMADIGGALDSNAVHEVYEEGLLIPPTRLYAEGQIVDAVLDFVRANVRVASAAASTTARAQSVCAAPESSRQPVTAFRTYGMERSANAVSPSLTPAMSWTVLGSVFVASTTLTRTTRSPSAADTPPPKTVLLRATA